MNNFLLQIWMNYVLMAGITGWLAAQVAKTLIHAIVNKEIKWERMVGDGGMPSAHSATVSSMAMISFLVYGVSSFEFAISTMLAIIVMHDAMGVRLETGKQAVILNELMVLLEDLGNKQIPAHKRLKEFVGHTPLQVTCGCVLGIIVAIINYVLRT